MNIVLTGMRGSGKSFYGRALAKALNWKFLDTDEMIEKEQNATITEIVQLHGWPYFRKLEKTLCQNLTNQELVNLDEYVIATGGGIIIDRENEALLRQNGKIILLYRDIDKCTEYIINGHKKDKRPSLKDPSVNILDPETLEKELTETWNEREKRYRQSADLIIDVSKEKDPEEILEMLGNI